VTLCLTLVTLSCNLAKSVTNYFLCCLDLYATKCSLKVTEILFFRDSTLSKKPAGSRFWPRRPTTRPRRTTRRWSTPATRWRRQGRRSSRASSRKPILEVSRTDMRPDRTSDQLLRICQPVERWQILPILLKCYCSQKSYPIWLIVKWSSKAMSNSILLFATFLRRF